MSEYDLCFSPSCSDEANSFKLLELPPDLHSLIEAAVQNSETLSFTIKGNASEDAVLCTKDKTYAMRSVVLSNSVLVVTPPSHGSATDFTDDAVVIRDQVNEIIELVPTVAKLHALTGLLRGLEYDEGDEDDRPRDTSTKFTLEDARSQIQASDAELHRGLKERKILIIDGKCSIVQLVWDDLHLPGALRPIAPAYLSNVLELLLNVLVSLSLHHTAAPEEEISSTLADEHEVAKSVSSQVMSWFGELHEGKWNMDVKSVVREVGLGVLRNHKHEPIEKDALIAKWKSIVGDTFESSVILDLLFGNYLESGSQTSGTEMLTYFPSSSLPADPASRFSDLFLTRSRWKSEEIAHFLTDIAINSKERDKLLLKYCRAITDTEGVWYTARARYNI